jgi:hypothetical protein
MGCIARFIYEGNHFFSGDFISFYGQDLIIVGNIDFPPAYLLFLIQKRSDCPDTVFAIDIGCEFEDGHGDGGNLWLLVLLVVGF